MAERRMFARSVVNSDTFLDMPASTRALYFHLGMEADDDGFLNNPRGLVRYFGGSQDDLKLLISKQFLIPFDSGVVVIRHWKQSNYIQKDRYRHTKCRTEMESLSLADGVYNLDTQCIQPVSEPDTGCIQSGYNPDTDCIHSIGEERVRKELGESYSSIAQSCETAPAPDCENQFAEPAIYDMLCTKNDVYHVTQSQIDAWAEDYPAIDVNQSLRNIRAWLRSNPKNRKTLRGCQRFINGWLKKDQDTAQKKQTGGVCRAGNDADAGFNADFWNYGTV